MRYLEEDRPSVHEAGHALLNVVLTGSPGRVDLSKDGSGSCRLWWDHDPELKLSTDDGAMVLHELLGSLAGIAAERRLMGTVDVVGAKHDYHDYERAVGQKHVYPELYALSTPRIQAVLDYVMERFEAQLRNAVEVLRPGQTTAEKLWHAMSQADGSGDLAWYRDFPVLGQGHWQRRWSELRQAVGRQHAYTVVDNPVIPPERDHTAFARRHRRLNEALGFSWRAPHA